MLPRFIYWLCLQNSGSKVQMKYAQNTPIPGNHAADTRLDSPNWNSHHPSPKILSWDINPVAHCLCLVFQSFFNKFFSYLRKTTNYSWSAMQQRHLITCCSSLHQNKCHRNGWQLEHNLMGDTDGLGGFEIAAQLTMLNVLHWKMSGYNRKSGYFLIVRTP